MSETNRLNSLRRDYAEPGNPIAFSAPGNIAREYRKRGIKVSDADVRQKVSSIESYYLHKEHKKIKDRNAFYVYGKREHVQLDLLDVRGLAPENDGVTFWLVACDAFSKKCFARVLKRKTALQVGRAIRSVIKEMGKYPKISCFFMDNGTEFRNKLLQRYLDKKKIKYLYSSGPIKAAIVERLNSTLEQILYRYLEHYQTYRYLDVFDLLIETYNNRGHRSIAYLTPNEAEMPLNQTRVLDAHNQRYTALLRKKKKPTLKVGDTVLVKNSKSTFQRGYHRRYNLEPFEIESVDTSRPVVMYVIRSLDKGDTITGKFYASELEKIDKSDDAWRFVPTGKTTTRRGKKYQWANFEGFTDKKHGRWVADDELLPI
jgi:hypothetical protein